MPEDDDLLRELNRKVDNMQRDINDIQGDVNILSTLNKERHRDDLINLIEGKFGRSDNKRRVWYYANGERNPESLSDAADIPIGSVYQCVSDMNREGLLLKDERDGTVYYGKSEITLDIGLESRLEDEIDDL
ncbi:MULTISPECIES: hypothetical protein [unclassified Haloferax]|uniref:hypothetical protein n=1 Tax=unclassified Haloferax TaxID=2625095 RepID=UPI0006780B14|nr:MULTISPECIES: hypothetical protein [unclassified Haloferax]